MHQHFANISALKDAIIAGDLGASRDAATQTISGFSGEQPEGWEPHIQSIVKQAENIGSIDALTEIAAHASAMASTCGQCHNALGIDIVDETTPQPEATGDGFEDFMQGHRWAAGRMWDGLIGPSDAAWEKGAKVLVDTALSLEDVGSRLTVTSDIKSIVDSFNESRAKAAGASEGQARQEVYANFLGACASCHQAMKSK
jgi:cytochrome c553